METEDKSTVSPFKTQKAAMFVFFVTRDHMCLNCSLSVKSMKFGMMIVFKALKKIGYGAIAKKVR